MVPLQNVLLHPKAKQLIETAARKRLALITVFVLQRGRVAYFQAKCPRDPARLIVPFLFELAHARLQIVDVLLQQIDVLVVEPLVAGLIARDLAHECAEIEQTLFDPIQR